MKISIRRSVFETNSSSVHSLTMCMESEWNKFQNGELVFDRYDGKLVPSSVLTEMVDEEDEDERNDRYWDADNIGGDYYESFSKSMVTPNGEKIIAFGYYGSDN